MLGGPTPAPETAPADQRALQSYLLLADISGYTAFLASVQRAHGVDFSDGIPAGYEILGRLLDAVIQALSPTFEIAKLEGDAVFALAPTNELDGQGNVILEQLRQVHRSFRAVREEATGARDHECVACPVVSVLDLKFILHRGTTVRVRSGALWEVHGPAVNVVHRLLKNDVRSRIGYQPYVLLTNDAAAGLELSDVGVAHDEEYADVGRVAGRVLSLG